MSTPRLAKSVRTRLRSADRRTCSNSLPLEGDAGAIGIRAFTDAKRDAMVSFRLKPMVAGISDLRRVIRHRACGM
jgi:hypothetical protein